MYVCVYVNIAKCNEIDSGAAQIQIFSTTRCSHACSIVCDDLSVICVSQHLAKKTAASNRTDCLHINNNNINRNRR